MNNSIPTNRLSGFDYGSNAFYFVTIYIKNREYYFGEIIYNNIVTHNNASSINNNELHNYKETHNGAPLQ